MIQTAPGLAALLPLKLSGRHYADNLGRLDVLLSSLLHFGEPGLLDAFLVVTPADEVRVVRRHLNGWPEFDMSVVVEEEHFPAFRRYQRPWQVRPWQRQQIIKLAAPNLTTAPFVLTLDPDVLAVQKLSRDLLLPGGRALLEPEPRSTHPTWWRASADVLDVPADVSGPGVGVTPALLSREILQSVHRRVEAVSGRPWMDTLLTTYDDWTEYTLYLLEAQRAGLLDDRHGVGRLPRFAGAPAGQCGTQRLDAARGLRAGRLTPLRRTRRRVVRCGPKQCRFARRGRGGGGGHHDSAAPQLRPRTPRR